MSTTLKIGYLRTLKLLGKKSLIANSVFGFPYRISLGDTFSENPYYNDYVNVGEILSVAAWVTTIENPVIYDIGGHCGFIATQLAQILRSSNPAIYSFEPVAPTFTDLVYSINELALKEFIHPVPVALGNRAGFVRLSYSKVNSMLAQVIPENQTSNQRGGEEIYLAPVLTTEDFSKIAPLADVIKIDVEGYEVLVFNGMQKLMLSEGFYQIGICLEWNPAALKDNGFLISDLYSCFPDYRFFYINDYEGQRYQELAEVFPLEILHVCNLFAVHSCSTRIEEWKQHFKGLKQKYNVKTS